MNYDILSISEENSLRMIDLIQKKKQGKVLDNDEINFIVQGFTRDHIPDYQMSAFLMAVYFKGMNEFEISNMTLAMANSGERIDLSMIDGIKVDKHSSGGVGDKLSIAIVPLVASFGVPVVKMSGRGLGHTGGTIDKLESIEGFNTKLSKEVFLYNLEHYKMVMVEQTLNITPADKKIYALRDVTATIDSIPLIASSIMSKKIASGADAIVLDVKVGSGAFMKSLDQAEKLAKTMVDIGKSLHKKTIAIITDMSQPLGSEIGNANEIKEAIAILRGEGSEDETIIALTIASYMTILGGAFTDFETAFHALKHCIQSGQALESLRKLIEIQGGNPSVIDNTDLLPQAKYHFEVKSEKNGFITSIEAEDIGSSAMYIGVGRKEKNDRIDYSAGITLLKKVGAKVLSGDTLCILHTNSKNYSEAKILVKGAFIIGNNKPAPITLIHRVIQ